MSQTKIDPPTSEKKENRGVVNALCGMMCERNAVKEASVLNKKSIYRFIVL